MAETDSHPVRLIVSDDLQRSRLTVFFRLLLTIPHFIWLALWGIAVFVVAFLAWFVCMARARMPKGFRNAVAYGVGYSAQAFSYALLLTDRYPNANPFALLEEDPVEHPVRLRSTDDLRRSRLTVFFRVLL